MCDGMLHMACSVLSNCKDVVRRPTTCPQHSGVSYEAPGLGNANSNRWFSLADWSTRPPALQFISLGALSLSTVSLSLYCWPPARSAVEHTSSYQPNASKETIPHPPDKTTTCPLRKRR